MTNPTGRTNAQKYEDSIGTVEARKNSLEELRVKRTQAELMVKELEVGKDNEVSERKNWKSPAEKYRIAVADELKYSGRYDAMNVLLEMAEQKMTELEKMKDVPVLSKECRNFLKTMAIEMRYNRRKRMDNKYLKKGRAVEDESIALYSELKGEYYENNKERRSNEWFTGEWDVREDGMDGLPTAVKEFKSRYDIDSFEDNRDEDTKKKERIQVLGYLDILKCPNGSIVNVLTNNDFDLIRDEIRREAFQYKPDELNGFDVPVARKIEIAKDNLFDKDAFDEFLHLELGEFEAGHLAIGESENEEAQAMYDSFVEVPLEDRIIEIEVEYDEEEIQAIKERIAECRVFMALMYNIHHVQPVA